MNLICPYKSSSCNWLKGQLHIHTTRSDGKDLPETVLRDYASSGYDFVSLTDHNICADKSLMAKDFGLVNIPGCEYRSSNEVPEVGLIGAETIPPFGISLEDSLNNAFASGAFVILNHPNWNFNHWPLRSMLANAASAHALEVYNRVIDFLAGPSEASDKWDILLSCGHRLSAVATDDAHLAERRKHTFVAVRADKNADSILASLKSGNYYSSSGIIIDNISLDGEVLRVESRNADLIRFFTDRGTMKKEVSASSAEYQICPNDVYVRAELYGANFAKAWTNPIYVESPESSARTSAFASDFPKKNF